MALPAARVSGHLEFRASFVDDDAVQVAAEASLSETLGVGVWQLNVTVLAMEDLWHVLYAMDLGPEFREVLVAGQQALVDSSRFQDTLVEELQQRSTNALGLRASFSLRVFSRLQVEELDPSILNSTSTTLTSQTRTTTTSTRTVLVYLQLLSATVREPFDSVTLAFNVPARFAAAPDVGGCSSTAFDVRTFLSLGHLPRCRWTNGTHLEITFGRGASARLGQKLTMATGGFEPVGNVAFLASPAFEVAMVSEGAGHVTPRLSHPTAVQACSRVSFSTLGSRGGAGRPLQVRWFMTLPTFTAVRESLQDLVDDASVEGARILELPPANFSLAVQRVRVVLGEISYAKIPVDVNVTAQVSNWLGAASNISGIVTVLKEESPLPVLLPTSPRSQRAASQDEVAFSVVTLSNDVSECVGSLSTSSLNVQAEWEYRPIPGRLWNRLPALQNLTDISRAPNTIRFAPFSFPPGTAHQFRVFVKYEGTTVQRRPNITFNLTVANKRWPVAIIQGPSEVGSSCPFVMNASRSRDDGSMDPDLAYAWSCSPVGSTDACDLANFADANISRMDGHGASGMLMHVHGGQLAPGVYLIGLSVRRQSETTADAGNATMELRVVAGSRPAISIEVPWEAQSPVSVAGDVRAVTAYADQTPECTVPESWASRFLLVEHMAPSRVVAFLEFFTTTSTTTSTTSTISTTTTLTSTITTSSTSSTSTTSSTTYEWENETTREGRNISNWDDLEDDKEDEEDDHAPFEDWQNVSQEDWHNESHEEGLQFPPGRLTFVTTDFPGGLLVPGRLYSYAFLYAEEDQLHELMGNETSDLESVQDEMDPLALAVSVPFRSDAPPSRGRVIVTPLLGEAFATDFRLATADWEDEDAELEYAFYRFPVRSAGPAPDSFDRWMHAFEMPEIEWDNASHPLHWRRQGGELLRFFSTSRTLEAIRLPAGAFFVVVRARDSTQVVSTAFAAAPWVSEAADDRSMVELLDAAQSSNDPDAIINAVAAVASKAEEELAELSLQLLLEATELLESEEVAVKCVEAVTAVLVSVSGSDGAPEAATLQRASTAIDRSLDAMGAVSGEAAALVLEGVSTVGIANTRGENRQLAAGVTAQVDDLMTKLAGRLLSQLPQGQVMEVSAGDPSGGGASSGLKVAKLGSSPAARRLASEATCTDSPQLIELSSLQMIQPLLAAEYEAAASSLPTSGPDLEVTENIWRSSNMYSWANPGLGMNAHVPSDTTIRSFAAGACGSSVTFYNLSVPVHLRLRLAPPGTPPAGFFLEPACAKWNEAMSAWRTEDLQVIDVDETQPDAALTCVSYEGAGAYTAFYTPMPEPTSTATSSSTTSTVSTSTTESMTSSTATGPLTTTVSSVTVTSTSVVWWATAITTRDIDIPFCSESDMPSSAPGAAPFVCYGPRRVGQECRAKCDPDPLNTDMAAISCLPDLSWAFSATCQAPTELVIVVTTETPTTNNDVMTTYGAIALGVLTLFLCGALCYSSSSYFRSAMMQEKASRVAPELPHSPSDASSPKSAQTAPAQLLFQSWAAESAKSLPSSPSARAKSPQRGEPPGPGPAGAGDGADPPADTSELRTLTVEGGFWDWAKEWSHASIVQVAMPDPSMQLAAAAQMPAPDVFDVDEDGLDDMDETEQALQLQNIGSDSDDAAKSPMPLTM